MSVQFGKCNFDGAPVDPGDLDKVRPLLASYGPDGEGRICRDNLGILFLVFHTTKESRREIQPYVSQSGALLAWDGRLDNREELIHLLGIEVSVRSTDLEIVAAAHEHWGTDSFPKLIGDWALSIWDAKNRCLILAKDFVGTRQLFYSLERDHVSWCTILDPLVLLAGHSFEVNKEYVAGWLACFPAPQLTPYVGIHSVPPSSYVRLEADKRTIVKYWDFDPSKRVRYSTDAGYEENFREVFASSVRRRLRSDTPVLAELSGGMDSSSIVCMADDLTLQRGTAAGTPRIDTVSYYDDSEPNCDDRAYFTIVERKRGRTGCHIRVSTQNGLSLHCTSASFIAVPGIAGDSESTAQLAASASLQGNRILLSGFGGDEVLGGVPTPVPELADLLARCRIRMLAHQLKVWALSQRKPWFHLLFEAVREFLPVRLSIFPQTNRPAQWLRSDFAHRYRSALVVDGSRTKIFGPLPSFQAHLRVLDILRRQMACAGPEPVALCEKRYPYLDRDLMEFLFAIPRSQLLRPGQRRSLMRRTMAGIVPDALLHRRRKAFVIRAPMAYIANHWLEVLEFSQHMASSSLGFVHEALFVNALQTVRQGQPVAIVPVLRTLAIEQWLRNPAVRKYLNVDEMAPTGLPSGALRAQTRGSARTVHGDSISAEKT
jgi:asparagine synthase (glutamine-hydrolysing)